MAVDAAEILDLAASLPESGEREYREGATIFTFRGRGLGYVTGDGSALYVKSTLTEREALVTTDPQTYSQWWSAGRFGWVRVRLDLVDAEEARELVVEAWRLTAPKRMVRAYDEAQS
ncbi:MAG: MmcQ/YjbR family DNA-binding protein [Marmoricola sp.]